MLFQSTQQGRLLILLIIGEVNLVKGDKIMPCYEVRTVSVEFKIGNIDLLKKAAEKLGYTLKEGVNSESFSLRNKYDSPVGVIDFKTGQFTTDRMGESQINSFVNSLKRSYSEQVIDEVAKKQKWQLRKMNKGAFQLIRY